ncbi:hypothetical protein [Granulicella arctica]|nr:hypothetical protein [Granulicella arctica]
MIFDELSRTMQHITRTMLKAYEEATGYCAKRKGHPHVEPKSIDEVPA